ncbi:MAG: DUF4398 domain-containing protein [Myxococcales bacterium]
MHKACIGLLAMITACLSASGCVASSAAVQSTRAARAVEHARRSHAGDQAPYEFTLAEAYLNKAREETAEAAYQDANRLARQSQDNAAKAIERSRQVRTTGGQ